jgi:hypothetical protein
MSAPVVAVRISLTIANEYCDRCPDFAPEACWMPGVHMVPVADAESMLSDARDYARSDVIEDVRPGVRRAYGALARQLCITLGGAA